MNGAIKKQKAGSTHRTEAPETEETKWLKEEESRRDRFQDYV